VTDDNRVNMTSHSQILSPEICSLEYDITRTLRYVEAIAAHDAKVAKETPWLQRMG